MECIYSMHFQSLNALRALKRNLMASISRIIMVISTWTVALVVAGVLSSSPMKSILKRNASEGNIFHIIILHNFERHVIQYLRVSRSKPSSSRTRRSIFLLFSCSLSSLQPQELSLPQREQKLTWAVARKRPSCLRLKWSGSWSSLDIT